jgi:8-oxo-dGTP pyrophosphatase MutT (NUDIX family)
MNTTKFVREWFTTDSVFNIAEEHKDTRVAQVYIWIYTTDKKLIIVSKDSRKWQFPGGKPNKGETLDQTAIREIYEETGIDIKQQVSELTFFGYYFQREVEVMSDINVDEFLQLRYILKLNKASTDLTLEPNEVEGERGQIQEVRAVTVEEACELIPWLGATEELGAFKSKI